MKKVSFLPFALTAALSLQPLVNGHAEEASSVLQMLGEGDTSLSFRYRYEFVDQDGIDKNANASTLKTRLTYKSASLNGLTALFEVDNVTLVGNESYRTPSNGKIGYPIVADPDGTDVNQVSLTYKSDGYRAILGRQRILHSGQRFVGGVGWRQNEQTYDAFTLSSKSLGPVAIDYSYIWDVNRIFGPKDSAAQPKRWESDSHILLAAMSPAKGHSVKGYAYLLDFADATANSSSTYGIEYRGKFDGFVLDAAYATQSDYAENPVSYEADYMMAQLTLPLKPMSVAVGYEVLGSDGGLVAFKTPLATLHKFQGWGDKFLGTPTNGVEDTYLKFSGKLGAAKLALIVHDFKADFGRADLGSELDVVATYPINKTVSVQLKYASYDADTHASDTEKFWMTVNAKF